MSEEPQAPDGPPERLWLVRNTLQRGPAWWFTLRADDAAAFAESGRTVVEYLPATPATRAADRLVEACKEAERWWLEEGMTHYDGAFAWVFMIRAALAEAAASPSPAAEPEGE